MRRWNTRMHAALRLLKRRRERAAVLVVALGVLVFGLVWGAGLPGSPESWNAIWHLPVLTDSLAILREGRLPLWNPRIGFGYPVWPVEGTLLANPLAWPFLKAGPAGLLRGVVISHILISLAAFWLLARWSGYTRGAALLGALVYAANGWLLACLFSGSYDAAVLAAALPLALLIRSGRWSRTVRWLAAGLLAAWTAAGAGLTGLVIVLVNLAFLRGLTSSGQTARPSGLLSRRPAALLALLCFAMLAGAVVLVPVAEFWARTRVSPSDADPVSVSLSFTALPEVFLPGLFGGGGEVPRWAGPASAPAGVYAGWLLLLPFIVWPASSTDSRQRLLSAVRVAGVTFALALIGSVFPFSRLARLFPDIASLLGLSRFAAAGVFALAWMIVISADTALCRMAEIRRRALIIFGAVAAICLLTALILSLLPSGGWCTVFEPVFARSGFQARLAAGQEPEYGRRWLPFAPPEVVTSLAPRALSQARTVLLLQAVSAALWAVLFWSAGRWRRLTAAFPELAALVAVLDLLTGSRHVRVWTPLDRLHPPSHPAAIPPDARLAVSRLPALRHSFLRHASGNISVVPPTTARLPVNQLQTIAVNPLLATGGRTAGKDADPTNSLRQLAAFGVTHLVVPGGQSASAGIADPFESKGEPGVREVVVSVPGSPGRLWGVSEIVAVEGRRTAVNRLVRPEFNPSVAAVSTEVIRLPDSGEATGAASVGSSDQFTVRVSAEPPNRLEVRAWAPQPTVLIVADTSWPGWRAEVNGRPVDIYEVNGWLRAVVLREGASFVRFRYQPFSFRLGLFLTLTASALWMAVAARYATRYWTRLTR